MLEQAGSQCDIGNDDFDRAAGVHRSAYTDGLPGAESLRAGNDTGAGHLAECRDDEQRDQEDRDLDDGGQIEMDTDRSEENRCKKAECQGLDLRVDAIVQFPPHGIPGEEHAGRESADQKVHAEPLGDDRQRES